MEICSLWLRLGILWLGQDSQQDDLNAKSQWDSSVQWRCDTGKRISWKQNLLWTCVTSLRDREVTTSKDFIARGISKAGKHFTTEKRWYQDYLTWKASLMGHSEHRPRWISGSCFFPRHCQRRAFVHTHPQWKCYTHPGTCHGKDLLLPMKGHLSLQRY